MTPVRHAASKKWADSCQLSAASFGASANSEFVQAARRAGSKWGLRPNQIGWQSAKAFCKNFREKVDGGFPNWEGWCSRVSPAEAGSGFVDGAVRGLTPTANPNVAQRA